MPCEYGPSSYQYNDLKAEADKVTRLLCTLCTYLEAREISFPDEVFLWWENHKNLDKARKLREKQQLQLQLEDKINRVNQLVDEVKTIKQKLDVPDDDIRWKNVKDE